MPTTEMTAAHSGGSGPSERRGRVLRLIVLSLAILCAGCTSLKRLVYEGFGRDQWQHSERVIHSLEIRPGDRVVDLGSGSGYFTFRLADAVGPSGKVYAVDVDAGLNEYVAQRAREKGYKNIEVILAKNDDPLIPPPAVDLIFTSNTYHHIEHRATYFARARKYLRPGGRVAIVDFKDTSWFHYLIGHSTPGTAIRSEMQAAGYRLEREFDFLSSQHFLVYATAVTEPAGQR